MAPDRVTSDGTISSYAWTFGDGSTGSGATPTHVYGSTGTFTVTHDDHRQQRRHGHGLGHHDRRRGELADVGEGLGHHGSDGASVVGTDASGNMYVAGQFRGTMVVGTSTLTSGGTAADLYLVKYAPDGSIVWIRSIGSATADENVKGIASTPPATSTSSAVSAARRTSAVPTSCAAASATCSWRNTARVRRAPMVEAFRRCHRQR